MGQQRITQCRRVGDTTRLTTNLWIQVAADDLAMTRMNRFHEFFFTTSLTLEKL